MRERMERAKSGSKTMDAGAIDNIMEMQTAARQNQQNNSEIDR